MVTGLGMVYFWVLFLSVFFLRHGREGVGGTIAKWKWSVLTEMNTLPCPAGGCGGAARYTSSRVLSGSDFVSYKSCMTLGLASLLQFRAMIFRA